MKRTIAAFVLFGVIVAAAMAGCGGVGGNDADNQAADGAAVPDVIGDSADSGDVLVDARDRDSAGGDPATPTDGYQATDLAGVADAPFSCHGCDGDPDCAQGWSCQTFAAQKQCVRPCNDDGDCARGFECYPIGSKRFCVPTTFECLACMGDEPCPEGKCCNFITGECQDCYTDCCVCEYDWECATGYGCWREYGTVGTCVPACVDGNCADAVNFDCQVQPGGKGLCVPVQDGCAPCSGDKRYPLGCGCVECRNDADCLDGAKCDPETHECGECADGLMYCAWDGCRECCSDADCVVLLGERARCVQEGVCRDVFTCDGQCPADYPVCEYFEGMEQCVECVTDADCESLMPGRGCTCMGAPLYTCVDSNGSMCHSHDYTCWASCLDAEDCGPVSEGNPAACSPADDLGAGTCYDPAGTCDSTGLCCGRGMNCFDLNLAICDIVGQPCGGVMPLPLENATFCECGTNADCLNGKECTELSGLCAMGEQLPTVIDFICPGGQLSPVLPTRVCGTLQEMTTGRVTR